jgi:hypothetical protein
MAYVTIDGRKYEQELLALTKKYATEAKDGKIARDGVAALFMSAADGQGVTNTEMKTLTYIREKFTFADDAASDFDERLARLLATKPEDAVEQQTGLRAWIAKVLGRKEP